MSTKDLFNKSNKVLTKSQAEKIKSDLESEELVRDVIASNNKFSSHIDYSKPENFSFYGSAKKYYEDSFTRIHTTYPYDGSESEKQKWINDSSELDLWILDNVYPRTTGYVNLGPTQTITVSGGPNREPTVVEGEPEELSKQYPAKQGNSNIWDTSIYRNSNLYLDGSLGNTIEFWIKESEPMATTIFNITNSFGALFSFYCNTISGKATIDYKDASGGGIENEEISISDFITSDWSHIAVSIVNYKTDIQIEIYKNGVNIYKSRTGTRTGEISQEGLSLTIGGHDTGVISIDDFRFWKRRRTAQEIGRYWHTNIYGGTNTDNNKYSEHNRSVDIGVYYKFNEGIIGTSSIDSVVLDYSGRISNGKIINYTNTVRNTGSAIDEFAAIERKEYKDPIIYSSHPSYVSKLAEYRNKGETYDYTNNSSIYHSMPAWIIEEDEQTGSDTKELAQIISSYFDNAQIHIKELPNLKNIEYYSLKDRNSKPFFLIRRSLESAGLTVPDLFTEASAFEEILSRGEQELYEQKIQDVKNTIYQNIYNNLSYIYKSKGTEKSFRNLIRCFGIDEELVRINMYSDGEDYKLEDSRITTSAKKKFLDFNNSNRVAGLVYTKAESGNSKSRSYIKGVPHTKSKNMAFTFETEVIFPRKISIDHPAYFVPTSTEDHIAFLGEYGEFYPVPYTTNRIFSLKSVKENNDVHSENVKFVLSIGGSDTTSAVETLETRIFKGVYENSKWNIAVRIVPVKQLGSVVTGGESTTYRAELYCVRTLADSIEEETLVTKIIPVSNYMTIDKHLAVGALHGSGNAESATINNDTRLKIGSTLFWYDNITNEEIKAHATDATNFGRLHPNDDAYAFDGSLSTGTPKTSTSSADVRVPKRDTLVLHWDYSEVTTSNPSGEFLVHDLAEGFERIPTPINTKAISLDGTGAYVEISDSDTFTFSDDAGDKPFSVSAWVYVGDITVDNGPFVAKTNFNTSQTEWLFKHNEGSLQFLLYDNTTSASGSMLNCTATTTTLTSNNWHFVTATYDGSGSQSGLNIYTDGVLVSSTKQKNGNYIKMRNTNVPVCLGASEDIANANRLFEDKLADICIFDKELTTNEVLEIRNNGTIRNMEDFTAYSSIISWWKMGDDQDVDGPNGIKDYKGTFHGTMKNNASIVDDETTPSESVISGRYGWFTDLVGCQVTGLGKWFAENDNQVVNREYIYSAKHRQPEVLNTEELVQIRTQDDILFTKDAAITSHFFAAEKSMYQVINDDIINLFATIVEFNDMIGQPVNRYRLQYKALEKFRQRYFEKVKNVPSLEKYVELYKWIDSSIGLMIQQLIPVSSNFSADLRTMVESHVLERNKYWTKFPTLEMAGDPPLGIAKGINELTYNWKDGHFAHKDPEYFASFNGTTSNILAADAPNLSFTGEPMSISMWFRVSDLNQGLTTLLYKDGEYFINIEPQPTDQLSAIWFGAKSATPSEELVVIFGKYIEAGRWYNLVMAYDGGLTQASVECYIDGHALPTNTIDSMPQSMADTGGSLTIGSGGVLFTEVDLSDVAIYSKILSQAEAEGLYNNASPLSVPELVSLWKLSGDAKDSKASNDGTETDVVYKTNIVKEEDFLWSDQRLEGNNPILSTGNPEVDKKREKLRMVATRTSQGNVKVRKRGSKYVEENLPILRTSSSTTYEGRTYVNRALSKPYKMSIEKVLTLRGGVNYSETTKDPNSFIRASTKIVPGSATAGIKLNGLVPNPVTYEEWKELYTVKRTSTVTIKDTEISLDIGMDGDVIYPYYGDSYVDALASLVNIHSDSYGDDAEIPVQGPFTETWVGGNQHRHIDLSVQTNRPEFYLDDNDTLKHPQEVDSNNPAARYTRDEVAKRPVNVKNIKSTNRQQTFSYDFEEATIGQFPAGWSPVLTSACTVEQNKAATNKALIFHSTRPAIPAGEASLYENNVTHYSGASIDRSFTAPLTVSFRAYEGVNNAENYLASENMPESNQNNFLYIQYSSDGTTWNNLGEPIDPGKAVWDFSQQITRHISDSGEFYLRWVAVTEVNGDNDHWGIDDIVIRPTPVRDRRLGNYEKNYQAVQTSGRSINNRWLVKNDGNISTNYTASPYVSGTLDFELPNRNEISANLSIFNSDHVFVERFSAPGDPLTLSRGHLDRISEEFSVYNSSNYRNFNKREVHFKDLYAHNAFFDGSQGYVADSNAKANIHKVNRNTNHTPLGKDYDNAYISHQIPRTDFQYNIEFLQPNRTTYGPLELKVTTSPADPPEGAGFIFRHIDYQGAPNAPIEIHSKVTVGFEAAPDPNNVVGENLYFQYSFDPTTTWTTSKIFIQGSGKTSHVEELDLGQSAENPLYIRWLARKSTSASAGIWYITNIKITPVSFDKYIEEGDIIKGNEGYNAPYADYQAAGWRMTRTLEKPAVALQRKSNTFSQIDRAPSHVDRTTTSYVEPAVSWNKPNTHYIVSERTDNFLRNIYSPGGGQIRVPYNIYLDRVRNMSRPITYSYANDLEKFANPDLMDALDLNTAQEDKFYDSLSTLFERGGLYFSRALFREIVYPRHENVALKKSRMRTKFDTYKVFWKDKFFDRIKLDDTTKLGYKLPREFTDAFKQRASLYALDNFFYKQDFGYISFDGVDDYVEVPDDSSLSFTDGPMSVSMWVNIPDLSKGGFQTLLYKVGEYYVNFCFNDEKGRLIELGLYDGEGGSIRGIYYKNTLEENRWYNFVFTYDGSLNIQGICLYINGKKQYSPRSDTMASQPDDKETVFKIGSGNGNLHSKIKMRDLALFNKALSYEDAVEIYNEASYDTIQSKSNIVSHWKLHSDANDYVGSNHGTNNGATFLSSEEVYKVVGDLSYVGENRTRNEIIREDVGILNSRANGLVGLEELEPDSLVNTIVPVYYSQVLEREKLSTVPHPLLYHTPYNVDYQESQGWIERRSRDRLTKPTYNDYSSFSEEIKLAAQKYGLVSEYRVSEHMDKYIFENGGNFRVKNYDFLTLEGASHDGVSHTLSSGTSIVSSTFIYSIERESLDLEVKAYPTSPTDTATLVRNNSFGYREYNPIYSPAASTFDISNSVNSEIEINKNEVFENYIPKEPFQSGINAAGKFNITSSDDDYLVIDVDNFSKTGTPTPNAVNLLKISPQQPGASQEASPIAISIWAQPEHVALEDQSVGLWTFGSCNSQGTATAEKLSLFSNYYLSSLADNTTTGFKNLGLTFVASADADDGLPHDSTIDDNSSVYTFFKADATPAKMIEGVMNNIILQIIPPTQFDDANQNYLLKLWLNGEELYGVHIRELDATVYSNRGGTGGAGIFGYSPCPIGKYEVPSNTDTPWMIDYDANFNAGSLKGIDYLKTLIIGNADLEATNTAAIDTRYKFKGLIDELTIFRGLLPASSIARIYNNGIPNNVGELIENTELASNMFFNAEVVLRFGIGFPPHTITLPVDNGEFDIDQSSPSNRMIVIKESDMFFSGQARPMVTKRSFGTSYGFIEQMNVGLASLPVWHRIGVPSYNKAISQPQWDSEFLQTYVETDSMSFIEKAKKRHDELDVNSSDRVRLKVNAIKKLLPYEGFYPQDRTVQLSKLFINKIERDIRFSEKVGKGQALQAAMQHFFAPGILYNSLKAGVACDWATYTNYNGLQPSYFGKPISYYEDANALPEIKYLPYATPDWYAYANATGSDLVDDSPSTLAEGLSGFLGLAIPNRTDNNLSFTTSGSDDYTYNQEITDLVITKAPNKRLPFEAILNPYKYLRDNSDGELNGNVKRRSNQHYLMNPSYYKDIVKAQISKSAGAEETINVNETFSQYKKYNFPYFEISSESKDFRYEMAVNNFLAESTKFFIADSSLTSFVSQPQADGYFMESGSTYYMDVVMEKTPTFKPVNSPSSLGGRYFGPPVQWQLPSAEFATYTDNADKIRDPAFTPYVPSYLFARSKVTVSFTATKPGRQGYSLSEIFLGLETTEDQDDLSQFFVEQAVTLRRIGLTDRTPKPSTPNRADASLAYMNRMPLSASIELKGITNRYKTTSRPDGSTISVESPDASEHDTWVIYSKFECPLFNFERAPGASLDKTSIDTSVIETKDNETFDYSVSQLDPQNENRFTTDSRSGCGIWTAQGSQTEDEGVFLSIEESFQDYTTLANSGSLMQVCGFRPQTQQLGRVANGKDIFEAVVMIPYLDKPLLLSTNVGTAGINMVYGTVKIDDRNFIKVNAEAYHRHKKVILGEQQGPLYTIPSPTQGSDIQLPVDSSSYTRMYEGMKKYNMPPAYDFETFNDIHPFFIYFFEFKQRLDKEDLSNIWQGIQPKIARRAFLDSVEIDHPINENEFFGNLGGIPDGIKWMVFKVKKKAEKSYFKMTEDSRDDSRFKFNFDQGVREPEYGYNYPYDYFTMLEMIQVEAAQELHIDVADLRNKTTGRLEDEE